MPPQHQVTSSQHQSQPRIHYFISRTNGTLVPLIPADELPFDVRLQCVPRFLTFDQTYGMQHVGIAPYTGLLFKSEHNGTMHRSTSQPQTPTHSRSHSNSDPHQFQAPDALARQAISNANNAHTLHHQHCPPQRPLSAHELATNWRKAPTSEPADDTQAIINAIVSSGAGAETAARIGYATQPPIKPPSGHVPDQNKKEHCTHWIRTGECDFTQQGCLYKHEMPDEETLRKKIGLRKFPQWWIEKTRPIKLSGEKVTVGPVVPPSVWLNQKRGSNSSSSDGSDDSSDSDTASTKSTEEPARKVTGAPEDDNARPAATTTLMTNSRKQSKIGDLIDSAPLLPTPSTTPSSTPPSSTNGSPVSGSEVAVHLSENEPQEEHSVKQSNSIKVSVPRDESPVKHIAEAKKRVNRSMTSQARSGNESEVQPLDKQIQLLQKSQHNGLMASKYALSPRAGVQGSEQPASRLTKSGCRVRRPASSSTAAASTVHHNKD